MSERSALKDVPAWRDNRITKELPIKLAAELLRCMLHNIPETTACKHSRNQSRRNWLCLHLLCSQLLTSRSKQVKHSGSGRSSMDRQSHTISAIEPCQCTHSVLWLQATN